MGNRPITPFSSNFVEIPSCRHPSKALHSKDTQLVLGQIRNVIMAFVPGLPNRCAPPIDQCVSRWTSGSRQNMPHRNSTALFRQLRSDPQPANFRQLHMKPLHLSAGEVLFDVQVQSDQREDQSDWLCSLIGMLSRIRVHNVLMNKRRIWVRQRVARKFVIRVVQVRRHSSLLTNRTIPWEGELPLHTSSAASGGQASAPGAVGTAMGTRKLLARR